jgi:hypothetical protein
MDENWEYEELDEHTSWDCDCHDWRYLPQGVVGLGSLSAVAGALRPFADELDDLATEGWKLEEPVREEGTLRLVRR